MVPGAGETGASEVIGGFAGSAINAFIGGLLGDKAQSEALKKLAPDVHDTLEKYQAADQENHPVAAFAGDVVGGAAIFKLAPFEAAKGAAALIKISKGETTWAKLDKTAKDAVSALAIQTGMGAAFGVAGALVDGQTPTIKGVTTSIAQAMLLGHPRDFTGSGAKPAATPAAKPDIDPTTTYKVTLEQTAALTELAQRDATKTLSEDDTANLSALNSDPSRAIEQAFYKGELQRQQAANPPVVASPVAPPSEPAVTPAEVSTSPPVAIPAPVEAVAPLSSVATPADEVKPPSTVDPETVRTPATGPLPPSPPATVDPFPRRWLDDGPHGVGDDIGPV